MDNAIQVLIQERNNAVNVLNLRRRIHGDTAVALAKAIAAVDAQLAYVDELNAAIATLENDQ